MSNEDSNTPQKIIYMTQAQKYNTIAKKNYSPIKTVLIVLTVGAVMFLIVSLSSELKQSKGYIAELEAKVSLLQQQVKLKDDQLFMQYDFMIKYSRHQKWVIDRQNEEQFKGYYQILSDDPLTIQKTLSGLQWLQNPTSFPNFRLFRSSGSSVSIKIQTTLNMNIYIGAKIQQPRMICYLNLKNKKIYEGQYFNTASIVKSSNSSLTIQENDTITLFNDPLTNQIFWYVNKVYFAHIKMPKDFIYPIIVLEDQGDTISIT